MGDGPVDASLKAAERALDMDIELKEFKMRAITEGKDALGEAVVKIAIGGKVFQGRGISTDIVTSSVNAYVSAVNSMYLSRELEEEKH